MFMDYHITDLFCRYGLDDSSNGRFAIDATSGSIVTTTALDREQQATHTLIVTASDQGLLSRTAVALLTVHIDDTNDNSPVFPLRMYTTYIRDPTSAGMRMFSLN